MFCSWEQFIEEQLDFNGIISVLVYHFQLDGSTEHCIYQNAMRITLPAKKGKVNHMPKKMMTQVAYHGVLVEWRLFLSKLPLGIWGYACI